MYVPKQFREDRPEILAAAIGEIQLASLVTYVGEDYHVSHVPMVVRSGDGGLVLESHLARANPHWKALNGAKHRSIAIFQGPQAYVSPSWYPSKREHQKVVPTWNYIAIHASGALEAIDDGAWLMRHINDLTDANETPRDHPWAVDDAPADFIDGLVNAIVGLRLTVDHLAGSWKMIQHRPQSDRQGVIDGLAQSGVPAQLAVAAIMDGLEKTRVR